MAMLQRKSGVRSSNNEEQRSEREEVRAFNRFDTKTATKVMRISLNHWQYHASCFAVQTVIDSAMSVLCSECLQRLLGRDTTSLKTQAWWKYGVDGVDGQEFSRDLAALACTVPCHIIPHSS